MRAPRAWRWWVLLVVLVMMASGVWFVLTQEPDHPLGRRNYRRIKVGMSRDDVEQILGGPPGVIGEAPRQTAYGQLIEQEGPVNDLGGSEGKPEIWYSDRGQIVVLFDSWDKTARVVGKQLYRIAARR